jgi:hypothetical protein
MIYYGKAVHGEAAMIPQQDLSKQEEYLAEARQWITDCRWRDEREDLAELTDTEVIAVSINIIKAVGVGFVCLRVRSSFQYMIQ